MYTLLTGVACQAPHRSFTKGSSTMSVESIRIRPTDLISGDRVRFTNKKGVATTGIVREVLKNGWVRISPSKDPETVVAVAPAKLLSKMSPTTLTPKRAPETKSEAPPLELWGYVRVSTSEQNPQMQRDALLAAGTPPERIFTDTQSGAEIRRPQLMHLMDTIPRGGTLVVWRLDRFARSVLDLERLTGELASKGCSFKSLTEGFETVSPSGRLVYHILGAIAEFERHLALERTKAGMAAAKDRGVHCGRPNALTKVDKIDIAIAHQNGMRLRAIARDLDLSVSTVSRANREGQLLLKEPGNVEAGFVLPSRPMGLSDHDPYAEPEPVGERSPNITVKPTT